MRFPTEKTAKQKLWKLLQSLPKVASGAECFFVPLSETVGAKVYDSKRGRDFAFTMQKAFATIDMGPKVASYRFSFQLNDETFENINNHIGISNNKLYAYITEIVEVKHRVGRRIPLHWHCKTMRRDCHIEWQLEDIGLDYCDILVDLHDENIGFKNGKYIMIDFGECSFHSVGTSVSSLRKKICKISRSKRQLAK